MKDVVIALRADDQGHAEVNRGMADTFKIVLRCLSLGLAKTLISKSGKKIGESQIECNLLQLVSFFKLHVALQ